MNLKNLVVPGALVSEKAYRGEGVYVEDGKTYSAVMGMVDSERLIPLKGQYFPKRGDYIIGVVKEEGFYGWMVDLNSPFEGKISARDTREKFKIGDVVSSKVFSVDEIGEALLSEPRRFWDGEVLEIEPVKVPRVIGKNASMISLIKQHAQSEIFVGQNGRLYLKGGNTALAVIAILKICREAHVSGLTDRMTAFLQHGGKE
ncbi:MAG TPA: exosome complex protein Rrp4 [Candidatus Norongarragalinales archaeon]|nr:exosome complex protein Rrp4 [Candidatus Norongarragalinales archaeon]